MLLAWENILIKKDARTAEEEIRHPASKEMVAEP
jgi:hypothetical protein